MEKYCILYKIDLINSEIFIMVPITLNLVHTNTSHIKILYSSQFPLQYIFEYICLGLAQKTTLFRIESNV